jgi:hypothetical protein
MLKTTGGVYPGDPRVYTGPSLVVDTHTYRNLALHRPVYQSSAYDYNLTAQLASDGIKDTAGPRTAIDAFRRPMTAFSTPTRAQSVEDTCSDGSRESCSEQELRSHRTSSIH